jgi:hypothetical protein
MSCLFLTFILIIVTRPPVSALRNNGFRNEHSCQSSVLLDKMKVIILPALSDNYMYLVSPSCTVGTQFHSSFLDSGRGNKTGCDRRPRQSRHRPRSCAKRGGQFDQGVDHTPPLGPRRGQRTARAEVQERVAGFRGRPAHRGPDQYGQTRRQILNWRHQR